MPDLFFYRDPEEAARAEEVVDRTICIYNFPPLPFQVIASKQADFDAPPAKEEWGGEELASAAAQVQRLGVFQLRELLRAKRRSARLGCFWRVFPRLGERPPLQVPRRKFCGIHRLPSRLAAAFWSSCDFVNALWQHLLDNSCIFRFFSVQTRYFKKCAIGDEVFPLPQLRKLSATSPAGCCRLPFCTTEV